MIILNTSEYTTLIFDPDKSIVLMYSKNITIVFGIPSPEVLAIVSEGIKELVVLMDDASRVKEKLGFKDRIPALTTQKELEEWFSSLGLEVLEPVKKKLAVKQPPVVKKEFSKHEAMDLDL